jgi:hypothetical protein
MLPEKLRIYKMTTLCIIPVFMTTILLYLVPVPVLVFILVALYGTSGVRSSHTNACTSMNMDKSAFNFCRYSSL